ncbi:hypothetical protein CIW52_06865 [Mycolicibacterium sp. P9-64]|uniref:AAA family ATPase n=1 Tax=Mycolicibacterium sp. P9-64 TaxID=2024612 RepID=UPI0011EFDB52|nr:AAA family ATPase [Mycolicibacterium sp. P9-64]KAA0085607.1 hypothetical protein CIW52_06865 [Mycolicibacterium sp. P9-64]
MHPDWLVLALSVTAVIVAYVAGERRKSLLRRFRRGLQVAAERRRADKLRGYDKKLDHLRPPEVSGHDFDRRLPSPSVEDPYFYITQLRLQNFRCFSDSQLDFRFPGESNRRLEYPNVNLLLGNNGSGKSSVLRAVAIVALGQILSSSGFLPYRLVRQGADRARITAAFASGHPNGADALVGEVRIDRLGSGTLERAEPTSTGFWRGIFEDQTPQFLVVAYGANRRMAQSTKDISLDGGSQAFRFNRVRGLFNDGVALSPLGDWLPSAIKRRPDEVEEMLSALLPEGTRLTRKTEDEQPVFRRKGVEVPLRALSDGMQSYIGWLGDLLRQLDLVAGHRELREVGGIVMVDEIDLLLHPSWQREVVPAVSAMFPKIQFIFTTHSPIVTGTLESGNITVANEDPDSGVSTLRTIDAEVRGLSAEQVLLSSYFELPSTRAQGVTESLSSLARHAVEGDAAARRKYLQALVEGWGSEEAPR